MTRLPMPMDPRRKKLLAAVRAEYRRLRRELAPMLAALPDEEMRNINVAQNVIRDCLTVLLNEMAPYSHLTAVEMSQRAASYALSSVPIEDQEAVVAEHIATFAEHHMLRTSTGAIIPAAWRMHDGTEQSNFPTEER